MRMPRRLLLRLQRLDRNLTECGNVFESGGEGCRRLRSHDAGGERESTIVKTVGLVVCARLDSDR